MESTACQTPLEESQPVTVPFCCMSDIYLGSPEWRWICPARIRSNRHMIQSMTLPGGQNVQFEVPRCEGREELPPDPGIGWLIMRHGGSRGTSRMPQLCRPFRVVCPGSLIQWPPLECTCQDLMTSPWRCAHMIARWTKYHDEWLR